MRSRLQSIIATLKELSDDEIFSWTIELERVVKSCNETAFKKMIENLKDG